MNKKTKNQDPTNFDGVALYTGIPAQEQQLDTINETALMQSVGSNSLMNIEQSRAIAETQAAMIMARLKPRDENKAFLKIMNACKRRSLALKATYSFPRGGQTIKDASIRLAEVLARYWENCQYGLNELSRENGVSHVEAYFWDLETNTRISRKFTVKHVRETKAGTYPLESERDIYELVANYGQRRVRACILEGIPGDIVEAALERCRETLSKSDGVPLEDRIRKMLQKFMEVGVTQDQIEYYLGHPVKVPPTTNEDLVDLTEIYQSIQDGVSRKEDYFKLTNGNGDSQKTNDQQGNNKKPNS